MSDLKVVSDTGTHKIMIAQNATIVDSATDRIRIISKRALTKRFDPLEWRAFRESTDENVMDMREDLRDYSRYVDLDLEDFTNAVNYLFSINIISEETKVKLESDGTEQEKYRGVL